MNKTRRFFRRNKAAASENKPAILTPEVTLECGEYCVNAIACVPNHELIAVTAESNNVFIHEYTSHGEPVRVFDGHKVEVTGLLHLCDDILATVDEHGMLLTWRARTGLLLDKIEVSHDTCSAMTKASPTEIIVRTRNVNLTIVTHADGNNLAVKKHCTSDLDLEISDANAYKDAFVTVGRTKAQIWKCSKGDLLHTFDKDIWRFRSVAVSDDLIVLGREDGNIYVHETRDGYNLVRTIDIREFLHSEQKYSPINDISFLNTGIIMVTTEDTGIFFLSVASGQCILHCQIENSKDF